MQYSNCFRGHRGEGRSYFPHSVLMVWNWLKNSKSLAQKCWVMSLGPFPSVRLKGIVLWKHPALNGGYVPKLVKGRILSNKSRSSWTNMSLCSSVAFTRRVATKKPPHIPHSCWINGLWFTSLSGGEHGSSLTVYMLPPPYAFTGDRRRDPSIILWSIPSQNLMQSLMSPCTGWNRPMSSVASAAAGGQNDKFYMHLNI